MAGRSRGGIVCGVLWQAAAVGRLSWPRMVAQARKVTGIPAAQAVLRRPRVERVVALFVRSTVVEESARFVARELLPGRRREIYRLRGSTSRVVIRHGTADVVTLDEVFHVRDYELPEAIARELDPLDAPRVLDLGANIGLFGLFVLNRYPRARITSIEADPANAAVLRECIAINRAGERWEVVEAVAAAREGTASFVAGEYSLSHVAAPGETGIPVRSVDVFGTSPRRISRRSTSRAGVGDVSATCAWPTRRCGRSSWSTTRSPVRRRIPGKRHPLR